MNHDSVTGRWTAKDPIGFSGGLNFYGYAIDDPVNLLDPLGLLVGKTLFQALRAVTGQTAQEAQVAGQVFDSTISAGITATSPHNVVPGWVGQVFDGLQLAGGVQTVFFSQSLAMGIWGTGATLSTAGAGIVVPAAFAFFGGVEIGLALDNLYMRARGQSLGEDVYDAYAWLRCRGTATPSTAGLALGRQFLTR